MLVVTVGYQRFGVYAASIFSTYETFFSYHTTTQHHIPENLEYKENISVVKICVSPARIRTWYPIIQVTSITMLPLNYDN
jgi:hypothetical protein